MSRKSCCQGDGGVYGGPRGWWKARRPRLEPLEPRLPLDVSLGEAQVLFESDLVDPINVQTADLDGDGRSDVIAQSQFDQSIVWLRNLGDEGFARPQFIASPIDRFPVRVTADGVPGQASLPEIHIWDVDIDGDLDLVVAWWKDVEPQPRVVSRVGEIAWLENDDGAGAAWQVHVIGTAEFGPRSANKSYMRTARGDFNADGRDDLAVLWTAVENPLFPYTLRAQVSWFAARWDGSGFGNRIHLDEISFSPFLSTLAAADVDVDGDFDLTLALQTLGEPPEYARSTEAYWYENDPASGGLQTGEVLAASDDYFASASFGDLDEDGDLDLLVETWRDTYPHRVIGWRENVAGQFTSDLQVITSIHDGFNQVPSSVATRGDLDGDGRQDLIVAGAGNNGASGIGWYAFDADTDRLVLRSALPALTSPTSEWKFLVTMDVDRDGDLDLVASSVESDYQTAEADTVLYWCENLDGDGRFGLPQFLTRFEGEWRYALANESEGDLLVGWSTTPLDAIALLKPLPPDGSSGLPWRLTHVLKSSGFEEAWLVTAADVHRDGFVDLVAAAPPYGSYQRILYARDIRAGVDNREPPLDPPALYLSLKFADLVPGGPAELLYTTYYEVGWQFDASGDRPIFRTQDRVDAAVAGDLDGDGDEDVLVAVTATSPNVDSAILMIENRGSMDAFDIDFAVPRVMATAEARELNVGDIDGDGDMDVYSESGVWLNADGKGRLELLMSLDPSYRIVAASDFDADGDLDLLLRNDALHLAEYDSRTGTLLPPRVLPQPMEGWDEGDFIPVDLDSDGDQDIVGVTRRAIWERRDGDWYTVGIATQAFWLENMGGTRSFAPAKRLAIDVPTRTISASRSGPISVQPLDWDADGDADLFVTGWADGQTKVLLYLNESTVPAPVAGDFDGNGHVSQSDLDLVLASWGRDSGYLPDGWNAERPSGFVGQRELDAVLQNWGGLQADPNEVRPSTTIGPAASSAKLPAVARRKLRHVRDHSAISPELAVLEQQFGAARVIGRGRR